MRGLGAAPLPSDMGYACPVCGAPQRDAEHLADHLAFTALLHGADHEAFLDERVPDWADRGPEGLGADLVEYAPETEVEETTGHDHGRDFEEHLAREAGYGRDAGLNAAPDDVLERARDLTAEMRDADEADTEKE